MRWLDSNVSKDYVMCRFTCEDCNYLENVATIYVVHSTSYAIYQLPEFDGTADLVKRLKENSTFL